MKLHSDRAATMRWVPLRSPVRNMPHERSTDSLDAVLDALEVETFSRYAPEPGRTWCKTYVWDATSALYCEIPHWVDRDGRTVSPGAPGGIETTANMIVADWLPTIGPTQGWVKTSGYAAQLAADIGKPAVVGWFSRRGPGHIAMITPSHGEPGTWISQAGAVCFRRGELVQGFGDRDDLVFWVHS